MRRTLLGLAVFLACFAAAGVSQIDTGLISGKVTDTTGAVVANATVSAEAIQTRSVRKTVTNQNGFYTISTLQPGEYELSAEAAGFSIIHQRLEVSVGSRSTLNAVLVVRAGHSEMTVIGEGGVQVETQTQTVSEVVDEKQITQLPTLTRNPYDLVGLAGNLGEDPTGRGVGAAVNGQRAASTNISLDGAENTNLFEASVGQAVPLDAVQEFRLSESTFSAEYGRASGAMVDVETRSGTNQLHGSLYEFSRVSLLASNTYDNNARGIERGHFTRNQFGYSLGGPIIKNRLFFFQSTEWTRIRSHQTSVALVPTPEFLAQTAAPTQAYFAAFDGGGATMNGPVFTKADLLAEGLSPVPGGSFDRLPPETPVLVQSAFQTFADAGGGSPENAYSLLGRADWNASENSKLFARYALEETGVFPGVVSASPYPGYDTGARSLNQNLVIAAAHVLTPNLVSQSKFGFSRLDQRYPLGKNPAGPILFFSGLTFFGLGVQLPGYQLEPQRIAQYLTQLNQAMSWTHGKHLLRMGGQYIHYREENLTPFAQLGFEDLGQETSDALDRFLDGRVFSFTTAIDPKGKFPCLSQPDGTPIPTPECTVTLPVRRPHFGRSYRSHNGAAYLQDSWHLSRRMVLNLGLRWEYYGVQHNKDARLDSNYYLGPGRTLTEKIRNGQVQIVPNSPIKSFYRPSFDNFGPRVGFAWDVQGNGKTSLRGGYGISFERNFGFVTNRLQWNPPAYSAVVLQAGTLQFPTISISNNSLGPLAAGSGKLPLPPAVVREMDANIRTAYANTWSLAVDRQLTRDMVLTMAYSGSHGVHLYSIADSNALGSGVVYAGDDPALNPFSRLNGRYATIALRGNGAFSIYHALQLRVKTNNLAKTGLSFTSNYTWSHAIDNLSSTFSESPNNFYVGFLDFLNPSQDRGDAEFDLRHRLIVGAIWESPFFVKSNNHWRGRILGGWTLAPIFEAETGTPFSIFDCRLALGSCPRYIPTQPVRTTGHPVPTGAPNFFEYIPLSPAVGYANRRVRFSEFGDCSLVPAPPCPFPANMSRRNAFRGPGGWHLDLGIYKSFKLWESWTLQFRGELYNAFNHPNFIVNKDQAEVSTN